jgi:predicted amidohydrolase YtcJ
VLPGFVDTHSHPHEAGLNHYAAQSVPELRSKLVKGRNFEDFLSGIKEIADKTPANVWVAVRLDPPDLANAFWLKHTFRDLDKVAAGKLVYINNGVTGLITSAGLAAMVKKYGFESELMRQPGLMDEKGQITGRFRAAVIRSIGADLVMEGKEDILADAYYKEMVDLGKYGVTTWSSTLQPIRSFDTFAELDRQGKLPVRLAYTHAAGFTNFPAAEGFYERLGPIQGHGTDHLWVIGATPANTDGAYPNICTSIEATKAIKQREQCLASPGTYSHKGFAAVARVGNRITGTHVSGDKGLDQMMDAIEEGSKAAGLTPDQIRSKRHATDHCDFGPRPDQIQRAIRLGLYFSCKANAVYGGSVNEFLEEYGEKYAAWVAPINSILKAGGKVVMELDSHLTDDHTVFEDLQAWVTRKNGNGKIIAPDERVDRITALKMITSWASEYVLRENLLGSLETGKWADLIVLDKDYLTVPEEEIKTIKVLMTLVGGKVVHSTPEVPAN